MFDNDDRSSVMSLRQMGSQITMLQKLRENYEKKAEQEKLKLEELKKEIEETKEKIEKQRLQLRSNQENKSSNEEIGKQIKAQEYILDRQLQKFNEAVAKNRKLRSLIDDLRKERNVYKKINKKLKEELKSKKQVLEKDLKDAEDIYLRKEALRKRLVDLKKDTEKQDTDYQEELRKLRILIEQDKKKGIFEEEGKKEDQKDSKGRGILTNKTKENSAAQKNKRQTSVNFYGNNQKSSPDKPLHSIKERAKSPVNLQSAHKSTLKLSSTKNQTQSGFFAHHTLKNESHYDKRENLQNSLKQVEQYETAFQQIKEASGMERLDDIVGLFVKWETKIFSRFSFINDMIAENDSLDEDIGKVEKEIEKYKAQIESEELSKQQNIQRFKQNVAGGSDNKFIGKVNEVDEEDEKDWKQTVKVMNSLKVGIQNIFENIGCSNEHTQELVGTHGVTESNMMQYLGIIEMRTNEILQMYAACQNKGLDSNQVINQQPINVAKEREKDRLYIDPPDVVNLEENKKKSADNERKKRENLGTQATGDDQNDDNKDNEKGDDNDVQALTKGELSKKASEFVKEHFDKYITKKKPKAKTQANK